MTRNRHAGEPFRDDDETIAAALADVSVPALMCSLVHMTGDPSWIRGDIRPRVANSLDIQSGLPPAERAEIRRRALPAIAAYRDAGCEPRELESELLLEMMAFLGTRPVGGRLADLFVDDLGFDGGDAGAITWGDQIPASAKAECGVVVIGAGLGGILAGIRLAQAGLPFTIVEKNDGPGGTWWENRYPGARVDIGSHQYCYSFEPAHHWSEYYCRQPELRAYLASIVDKYGLRPRIRFATTVTRVTWDDAQARWRVHVRPADGPADGPEEVLDARFVISAVGSLNLPRLPDIPGMDSFAGPSFHSARWPEGLDLAGTRFALIGAGASGFQIGPAVADDVKRLTIFQRTAQWIIPNRLYHAAVPAGERWALRHLPFYGRWFRFLTTYPGIALGTDPYRVDPDHHDPTGRSVNAGNAQRAEALAGWMTTLLADRPDLLPKVVPDYPAAGKRILQDDGTWLRTLARDDVELVRAAIDRIVPDGIVTADGVHHRADVICYATGFRHNDFLASMDVTGRGGVNLRAQWGDEPTAYLGITIPNFPNLFCVYGPGTNLAAGASLFYHSEFQVHHALEAIRQTLLSGARSCEVRPEVHDDYVERTQAELAQLVWSHESIRHSHFKNPNGRIYTLSPWPLDLYREWTRHADPDAYLFT
ncbi:NAD(P)/FAD-dependent oxidoreductase [Frankia sp. CNm7]|uniref:NAD(P)/FAD-dependent oxidoreductase n=1 Tax=Frankia nepalensis TaxID=1836974 RepID=A0A937UTA1_9ACTN|nr:NAD(P)/FAD-dependent oxidoreductase [Frankia nepalensis]MBL7502159.1 NAD(P)/FAD-dependent oxidoreductase [Frankia nepalensis]MBL7510575.1 NAD(P)/FAD-dependent oxidoreductase [Frankia nepalensis]MBL7523908.1 NAD(P)/FAD-dependent oxidoreductase [Frankia nepalensis]MBL7633362.1 NAD(P)/FAD-dependent oxidoreductase [Frankia nepalensis]